MIYIFARIAEESGHVSCILLSRRQTEGFLENPHSWPVREGFGDDAKLLDWFEVPLEALLALDALSNHPVVTDLLGTIFEAGYQLSERKKS